MKNNISQSLIAPCGMNCAICRAYLRQKNPCNGCRNAEQNKPETRTNCRLRLCDKRIGKFCCHCPEFACKRLQHLDKRYRIQYAMSEIENLEFIQKKGIRKFVVSERKKWISEKGIFCIHDKKYYK